MSTLDLIESPFDGCSLVEASAGTGKTWTLAALYSRLLLEQRLSVGNLLVVTFTQAATAELRLRIRARLAELLKIYEQGPGPDEFLNRLQARYPDDDSYRRLLLAVHGFDEAAVFTIHGYCQRVLQQAAFEAGGDFDSQLTPTDQPLIAGLVKDLWRRQMASAEPLWAQYLLRENINPESLARELAGHLNKPFVRVEPPPQPIPDLPDPTPQWQQAAGLWHSLGAQWFAALARHPGLNQNTHKNTNFGQWQGQLDRYFADPAGLLKKPAALAKFTATALRKATKKGHQPPPLEPLAGPLEQLAEAVDLAASLCEQHLLQLKVQLLAQLDDELPRRKAKQRVLAFDDLLNRLDQALSDPTSGAQLAQRLHEQYPVALVDEFQDTDPIQYQILSRIYGSAGQLCLVGDPKQSIYAFRGADLATYLKARQQAQHQYQLSINYRSSAPLVAALNTLFDRPLPFAQQDLDYLPVAAAPGPRPQLQLPFALAPVNLVWMQSDGEDMLTKTAAAEQAAADTAARIAGLLNAAQAGQAGFHCQDEPFRPLRGGDIAVLVYSNRQASLIARTLQAQGVASVRRSQDSVWHSEEADSLFAVLAAYAKPGADGLLRHALASRLLDRSPSQLDDQPQNAHQWEQALDDAIKYHRLWLERGLLPFFYCWLEQQQVATRLLQLPDGERRLTNLLQLAELLQQQSLILSGSEQLLNWFNDQRNEPNPGDDALMRLESDADRVQIVTIHSAKGLEYPLVFCPFLWDGQLMSKDPPVSCHGQDGQPVLDFSGEHFAQHQQQARAESFAERLRLAYVALTRARDYLWLHTGPVGIGTDQQKNRDNALPGSALGWLLHGRQLDADPLPSLAERLAGFQPGELRQDLQELVQVSGGTIALLNTEGGERALLMSSNGPAPEPLARLPGEVFSRWRISSFSALARGHHQEGADHDAASGPDPREPGAGFYAFPRGARAGSCLHAIFENWARGRGSLAELVGPALRDYGINVEQWQAITQSQLEAVLNCNLAGQGLTLAGLPAAKRLPEVGFTFAVPHLNMQRLKALLKDPAMGLEKQALEAVDGLTSKDLKGYLKGFIDLVFEHQGHWYIADYKSNWLGPDASHYGAEQLVQVIANEHYYLQYLIYLVALRRFLRQRLANFNNAQLGGAYYLFLRAMPEAGVYFFRPKDELLEQLDLLFGGQP